MVPKCELWPFRTMQPVACPVKARPSPRRVRVRMTDENKQYGEVVVKRIPMASAALSTMVPSASAADLYAKAPGHVVPVTTGRISTLVPMPAMRRKSSLDFDAAALGGALLDLGLLVST